MTNDSRVRKLLFKNGRSKESVQRFSESLHH